MNPRAAVLRNRGETAMAGRYKWVYHDDTKLYEVGILADGTLHNPRGYPEDVVRAAVLAADARRHERRSKAAEKAGETRRRRQHLRTAAVARRILAGQGIGAQQRCAICGRGLDDPASIERGVGSECWQDVLAIVDASHKSTLPGLNV
jgi:hypothetical protein